MTVLLSPTGGVCPCSTFDGEIGGFKFWHDWCDNGDWAPYRLNTVLIGSQFYDWFADMVDYPAIAAGMYEVKKS
jgi:hypothetical protein